MYTNRHEFIKIVAPSARHSLTSGETIVYQQKTLTSGERIAGRQREGVSAVPRQLRFAAKFSHQWCEKVSAVLTQLRGAHFAICHSECSKESRWSWVRLS
jgi:hypothetical protein